MHHRKLILPALLALCWQPGFVRAVSAADVPRPTAAVQALLDRAAHEPAEASSKTLDAAAQAAEAASDGPGMPAVAVQWNHRGSAAMDVGDVATAKELWRRVLAAREKYAPGSLEVAGSLHKMATIAGQEGDLDAARSLLERALAMREKLRPNSVAVAATLRSLAELPDETGRVAEAEQRLKQAEAMDGGKIIPATGPPEKTGRPVVVFLHPAPGSAVSGGSAEVAFALLAGQPLKAVRVWINGRPALGGQAIDLAKAAPEASRLPSGVTVEAPRNLAIAEEREEVAKELPAGAAALGRSPLYPHYQQVRLRLPLGEGAGAEPRVTVVVETTGGRFSEREVLRLQRAGSRDAKP